VLITALIASLPLAGCIGCCDRRVIAHEREDSLISLRPGLAEIVDDFSWGCIDNSLERFSRADYFRLSFLSFLIIPVR